MVRFLVLFPSDPLEASFAIQLLDRLNRSFADGWTGILVPEQSEWIVRGPVLADEILLFRKTPGECRNQIRDFLPDYLIDLSGDKRLWMFKMRTQLIQFTLMVKFLKANRLIQDIEERYADYSLELEKLLRAFELAENYRVNWEYPGSKEIKKRVLPESFIQSFGTVKMDTIRSLMIDRSEQIIDFFSRLDSPTVLLGSKDDRIAADLLTQKVGCSVFNTCGDLTKDEEHALLADSKFYMGVGIGIRAWAFLKKRKYLDLETI